MDFYIELAKEIGLALKKISGWVEPVWSSGSAGKVFLVTALFYLSGYLLYAGYLSRFSGGYGSITLNSLGIKLVDGLMLAPTALLTLLKSVENFIKTLLWIGGRLICFVITFGAVSIAGTILGAIITNLGVLVYSADPSYQNIALWMETGGFWIYLLGTYIFFVKVCSVEESSVRCFVSVLVDRMGKFWWWAVFPLVGMILIFVGESLVPGGLSIPSTGGGQGVKDVWVIRSLAWFIVLIFLPFLVLAFGHGMADVALQEGALSQVERVVLRKPRAKSIFSCYGGQVGSGEKSYNPISDLFLVGWFRDAVVFYLKGAQVEKMILVSKDDIASIEILGKDVEKQEG
jgi:hypothetical protein